MKLLYVVSDLTYPPLEGLHQQSALLAAALVRSGVKVTVLPLCKDRGLIDLDGFLNDTNADLGVEPIPYRGPSVFQGLRYSLGFGPSDHVGRFEGLIRDGDFDAVHLEGAAAAGLVRFSSNIPALVSWIDPGSRRWMRIAKDSDGWFRRAFSVFKALGARLLESRLNIDGTPWLFVSERDAEYAITNLHHRESWAIPVILPPELGGADICEDQREMMSRMTDFVVLIYLDLRTTHMRSAFRSLMSDDRWAELEDLKLTFRVLGRVPSDPQLKSWMKGKHCQFIEWADDVVDEICNADVVVLPDTVGTGLKNRAVQCLALGRPVIGTTVAFEGLSVQHGVSALIAHGPTEIVEYVGEVSNDPELASTLASNSSDAVTEIFDETRIVEAWKAAYERLTSTTGKVNDLTCLRISG